MAGCAGLACYTRRCRSVHQEQIAERENVPRSTVETILTESAELPESSKPAANHLTDFDPPIIPLLAEMRLGELLAGIPKIYGSSGRGTIVNIPSLPPGITKKVSHHWNDKGVVE